MQHQFLTYMYSTTTLLVSREMRLLFEKQDFHLKRTIEAYILE